METEIHTLREQIKSDDWKTRLSVADRLGDIGTDEGNSTSVGGLKSDNNFERHAAALGLMRTKNQKYFIH
jgi:HEAT repeat protein